MPPSEPDQPDRATNPVARVLLDVGLPHLDRPFDYRVRAEQAERAVPGARVRVRFAGRLTSGYILERVPASEHRGELSELERVVSPEPVLTGEVADLAGRVAEHYAGTRADVLRLAIPPRHARTEQAGARARDRREHRAPDPGGWRRYCGGPGMLEALRHGANPRAVTSVLPSEDWPALLAHAARAGLAGGRASLIIVPDTSDVARVDTALSAALGPGQHVTLHAEQGPSARYRRFLAVLRGDVRVVVGTRSAVFAPVSALGLLVVWDDGDDLLAEPRAPYPHARDVALIRAHQQGCGLLIAGYARTAEAARLVRTGWAQEVMPDRATVRANAPRVMVAGTHAESATRNARMPDEVFRTIRRGLEHGPVLVHVPRRGYRPALSCQACRTPARCPRCGGPLAQRQARGNPVCQWCQHVDTRWRCLECGSDRLRAGVVGDQRTAEELGRAFPGVTVRQSGLGHVLDDVADSPALVVATPGAEPRAPAGYAAAVLLDTHLALSRPDLRATEEALRRWMAAAALVRPASDGGTVQVVADPAHRAVQALVRWDPVGFAERELDEREAVHLPPAWRLAELTGPAPAVEELLGLCDLPTHADVLGPVGLDEGEVVRTLVRVPLHESVALTTALGRAAGVRSARRSPGSVRIRVDPVDLG